MGIAVSLILIAFGAILAWGITIEPSGLNLDAIGAVLIVVGIIGFLLSLLLWRTWWGPGYFRETYVEGGPARPWYYGGSWGRRRARYVEEDEPPPPGGPPPPPP